MTNVAFSRTVKSSKIVGSNTENFILRFASGIYVFVISGYSSVIGRNFSIFAVKHAYFCSVSLCVSLMLITLIV